MTASMPARIAGRYDVLEQLGAGGMGTVYRGIDIQTEQIVAIKHLKLDFIHLQEA